MVDSESLRVGAAVAIYWPDDKSWYPGFIQKKKDNGMYVIGYTDGEVEELDLSKESYKRVDSGKLIAELLEDLEGERIELYWDSDAMWYPGTVTEILNQSTGVIRIEYDDGDIQVVRIDTTSFRVIPAKRRPKQ